ncbi:hypothetical protein [Pinibacter soli]|uniref:Lipoprotein n=1 Tax=Pinibacter soli TaxID=3044211 RepID=A0ABT6RFT3_9BACT|nr:hypothetical protein [Pinibacter soli]MDI3321427.1 hypothetical protein [Pinibacter soli]
MNVIKTTIKYLIWLLLSISAGMGCMRIELEKPPAALTGFWAIFNGLHEFIIIRIGGLIGLISFILFVLIDLFYIKIKVETKLNQNILRIITILFLNIIVTLIHYVLEFVLDWI